MSEEKKTIEKQQNKIASLEKQIKLIQNCDLAKTIKEQQKEIEDWKFTSKYVEDNYISKDKIREKIKEKQDEINKLHPASDIVIIDDLENQINCYKELLEE